MYNLQFFRRNKFYIRTMLCNSQYFYAVDSDMYFNDDDDDDNNNNNNVDDNKNKNIDCTVVSTAKWLRKRVTILRDTFVASLKYRLCPNITLLSTSRSPPFIFQAKYLSHIPHACYMFNPSYPSSVLN
jgi:hypothetical protein